MMKTETDLLKLKAEIDSARIKVSELTGQKNALVKQLEEWGCNTIEEAEKKLKDMESEISNFDVKIASGIQELEVKYGS